MGSVQARALLVQKEPNDGGRASAWASNPMWLEHRTLFGILPPLARGASQGVCQKQRRMTCGLQAARVFLPHGRTITTCVPVLTCMASTALCPRGEARPVLAVAGTLHLRPYGFGTVAYSSARASARLAARGLSRHRMARSTGAVRATTARALSWEGGQGSFGTPGTKIAFFHCTEYRTKQPGRPQRWHEPGGIP
jgi:hypothetical protein